MPSLVSGRVLTQAQLCWPAFLLFTTFSYFPTSLTFSWRPGSLSWHSGPFESVLHLSFSLTTLLLSLSLLTLSPLLAFTKGEFAFSYLLSFVQISFPNFVFSFFLGLPVKIRREEGQHIGVSLRRNRVDLFSTSLDSLHSDQQCVVVHSCSHLVLSGFLVFAYL